MPLNCGPDGNRGNCNDEESCDEGEVLELSNDKDSPDYNSFPLDDADNFLLVLVVCNEVIERKQCFSDCEAGGLDNYTLIRTLLVPRGCIEYCSDENGGGGDEPTIDYVIPPKLYRFGRENGAINLCDIKSWKTFYKSYWKECKDFINGEVKDKFEDAYQDFYSGINDDNPFENIVTNLTNFFGGYIDPDSGQAIEAYSDIQYLYSYLRDLVVAFDEFYQTACGLPPAIDEDENDPGLK